MQKKISLAAILLLGGVFGPLSPARADEILTYTGNIFTSLHFGPYVESDKITATITLAAPLADDLPGVFVAPLSWEFNDGVQTISSATPSLTGAGFAFGTDASGAIDEWDIQVSTPDGFIETQNNLGNGVFDQGTYDAGDGHGGDGQNLKNPGVWTESSSPLPSSATPEPATWAMMILGLGGIGVLLRNKRQKRLA